MRRHESKREIGVLIVKLLRVARGLEADAEYLRARLFRAAAFGLLMQASRSAMRLGSGLEALGQEAIGELGSLEGRSGLAAELREELEGISLKRPAPAAEISVSVCQRCGEVITGGLMDRCPRCGAGFLAARPVNNAPYYDPLPSEELLPALAATPAICSELCADLDEEIARKGNWPVMDILDHLLGAQRVIWDRTQRMLDEDEPDLGQGVPPPRASDTGGQLSAQDLLRALRDERSELVARMRDLPHDALERGGTASNWGHTTVGQRLTYLARHEHDHLGDLAQSMAEARRPNSGIEHDTD